MSNELWRLRFDAWLFSAVALFDLAVVLRPDWVGGHSPEGALGVAIWFFVCFMLFCAAVCWRRVRRHRGER